MQTSKILLLSLYAFCCTLPYYGLCLVQSSVTDPPFDRVSGLADTAVTDNVYFTVTSWSKTHCAALCSKALDCESFTHMPGSSPLSSGSCRCYTAIPSAGFSASTGSPGALTYAIDPCKYHTVLADDRRDTSNGQSNLCDNLSMGWYRFKSQAGNNARMAGTTTPTSTSFYRCGTDIPLMLDLQYQSLPQVGQQLDSRACGPSCYWGTAVTVRLCSEGFYVYKMQQRNGCNIAFCTQPH